MADYRQYVAMRDYLREAEDAELIALIADDTHRKNVFGFFRGTLGDHARAIFREIHDRGIDGPH